MKGRNSFLLAIILLFIVVFVIIRNSKKYDYNIIKVQTLMNDSLETGDPCLIIHYQIVKNTDDNVEIKETYSDEISNKDSLYFKKYRLLKYPALIINNDTIYGRHTWKISATDVDRFVIKNDIHNDRIIISPHDILNLYNAKYSQTHSLSSFLKIVSLEAKLLYKYETFDETVHIGEKRLGKDIIFAKYDMFGDESLFLDY